MFFERLEKHIQHFPTTSELQKIQDILHDWNKGDLNQKLNKLNRLYQRAEYWLQGSCCFNKLFNAVFKQDQQVMRLYKIIYFLDDIQTNELSRLDFVINKLNEILVKPASQIVMPARF